MNNLGLLGAEIYRIYLHRVEVDSDCILAHGFLYRTFFWSVFLKNVNKFWKIKVFLECLGQIAGVPCLPVLLNEWDFIWNLNKFA